MTRTLRSRRRAAAALAAFWLASPVVHAVVPLKDTTFEYQPDATLAPLHQGLQMALLNKGWIPLAISEREITAETRVRDHYAKVRILLGEGKATFTFVEGRNLDLGPCDVWHHNQQAKFDACIHPAYYDWLDGVMAALPIARAEVAVLREAAARRP